MNLKDYFETTHGTGILATSDAEGRVDAAVYARPHVMEDGTVAMIMLDRLSHHNLQSNPHAAYLFMESGPGYRGVRLFLTKVREEEGGELLETLRRRMSPVERSIDSGRKFLVFFQVDEELPLVGSGT